MCTNRTALHFLAPEILDFQCNGYLATRMANRLALVHLKECIAAQEEQLGCDWNRHR